MMRRTKYVYVVLALIISPAAFVALRSFAADEHRLPPGQFRVTVAEVAETDAPIVKHFRIDVHPTARARIMSPNLRAITVAGGTDHFDLTATVRADRIATNAGSNETVKLRMTMQNHGAKSTISDAGPMVAEQPLTELVDVSLKSGLYEYGTDVPLLTFLDRTYSLTVEPPSSAP